MARWFPLIRRIVTGGGGGGAGFIASVISAGLEFTNQFRLVAAEVAPALATDAGRFALTTVTKVPALATALLGVSGTASVDTAAGVQAGAAPGDLGLLSAAAPAGQIVPSLRSFAGTSKAPAVATALNGMDGTAGNVQTDAAVSATTRISEFVQPSAPAAEIVQIEYDLLRYVGANGSANVSGSWTNLANVNGVENGTVTTSAGALGAGTRKLRGSYANMVNKDELTITEVTLLFWLAVTGDATGLLSDLTLAYNVGGGEVTLELIEGNTSNLAVAREYDITAAVGGDWSKIDALETFVTHAYSAASIGVTASVDAITVRIRANATQTI
jgi:hypothetical protein